jgi:hypothetical protein
MMMIELVDHWRVVDLYRLVIPVIVGHAGKQPSTLD